MTFMNPEQPADDARLRRRHPPKKILRQSAI